MAEGFAPARAAKPRKSQVTRARILKAAAQLFSDIGYESASLEAIARAAALRQGAVYYYFASKEALAEEVLAIGLRGSLEAVQSAIADAGAKAGFREKLHAAIHAHLTRALASDDFSRANIRIFYQMPAPVRARQARARARYSALWLALLEDGRGGGHVRADVDLKTAQLLLMGAMNWAIDWYEPRRHSLAALAEETAGLFLNGVGKGERQAK